MFLSNWLVFKIVLAAVTGLVDYPLAADVLLKYDDANKLYLSGGSLEYVSNVVLYKGETSYEIEDSPAVLMKTGTRVASFTRSAYHLLGGSQDGVWIAVEVDQAVTGAFQMYKGDMTSGVYTEFGSEVVHTSGTTVDGDTSWDGKYVLFGCNSTSSKVYKIAKNDFSSGLSILSTTYASLGNKTDGAGYRPTFVPGTYDFILTGTNNNSTFYIQMYKHNVGTDTWTAVGSSFQPTITGRPTRDGYQGYWVKSATSDGLYLLVGSYGTYAGWDIYKLDWTANSGVWINGMTTPSGASSNFGHSGGITPDGKYIIIGGSGGSVSDSYIYKNNTDGDWTSFTDVTTSHTFNSGFTHNIHFIDNNKRFIGSVESSPKTYYIDNFREDLLVDNYYITQPGTYRADLQICGIDYKTNEVEVTGSITPTNTFPTLTFDGYNQLSLTNTPTYTSSKLAYYSNVYDIGTLTSDITIEKPGEYASLTFDTSSNVAYFSNATVGTVLDAPATRAFFYGNFDDTFSDGDVTTAASNGRFYADMPETTTAFGTVSVTSSTSTSTTYQLVVSNELTGTNVLIVGGGGGGGNGQNNVYWPSAGGGGKVQNLTNQTISVGTYSIVVGNGSPNSTAGTTSSAFGTSAVGGGAGSVGTSGTSGSGNGPGSNSGYNVGGGGGDASSGGNAGNKGGSGGDGSNVSWLDGSIYGEQVSGQAYFGGGGFGGDAGGPVAGKGNNLPGTGGGGSYGQVGRSGMVAIYSSAGLGIKYLDFDTYNKLSIQNITPTATTLKYGSNTYDLGTRTDVYIENPGTYEAAITASDKFALVSNTASVSDVTDGYYREENKFYGTVSSGSFGRGWFDHPEFSASGKRLIVPSVSANEAYIYDYTGTWVLSKIINATFLGSSATTTIGRSVSIDNEGNTVIVCEENKAYLLRYINGSWTLITSITKGADAFGVSVCSLSGDGQRVVIGAYSLDNPDNEGKFFIYNIASDTFTQEAAFQGPSSSTYTSSRGYMNEDGTRIFVDSGSTIRVYERSGASSWSHITTINQGRNLAADKYGTRLVIGVHSSDTVYTYTRNSDGTFTQEQQISGTSSTNFGYSVEMNDAGDKIFIGVLNSNKVEVWTRSGSTWSLVNTLYGSASEDFGVVIGIDASGETLCVAAPSYSSSIGRVSIFHNFFPSLTFDTYNKLSIENITPTASTLRLGSNTYDIGTATDIYIEDTGTYEIETKDANTFALVSNVTGTVTQVDVYDYASSTEQKLTADANAANYDRFGESVAVSGDYAIIGAASDPGEEGAGNGAAYIFIRNGTSWSRQARIVATGGASSDQFGISVAIDGDYAVIGSSGDDDAGSSSGSAYIFVRSGTSWTQQYNLTAGTDAQAGDKFGISVSISGDSVIIGAESKNSNAGAAYVYVRNGSSWSLQQKITPSGATANDYFGGSVSISGNYAIIGARGDNSAYVFERNASTWSLHENLTASDGVAGDNFGFSVMIVGDYAIVGAVYGDSAVTDAGSAYVFKRNGTSWSEESILTASDAVNSDYFGQSVALDGDYAIVGAPYKNSYVGAVYIFKRSGTNWAQQTKMLASDGASSDFFGTFVAISGGYAFAGAFGDDDGGTNAGAAYIYTTPNIVPKLTHDTYNKLSIENITPTASTLRLGSNTYDIGTATDIYIEDTGTYEIETKDANTFAFASNVVSGTIKTIEPGFASRYQGSMALTYDGKLYAWGMNGDGEAGVGTSSDITVPTLCTGITQGTVAKLLSSSDITENSRGEVSVIKTTDGKIYMAGKGDNYCIPGKTSDQTSFTDVTSYFGDQSLTANTITMMSFTDRSGAALTETGNVWTWGTHDSTYKALGQAGASSSSTPKQINFSSATDNITKVTCGHYHSLALDSSGDVWFWGKNGINSDSWPSSITDEPQKVVDGKNIIGIASSYGNMYAWDATGKMWNAGNNWEGQIGDGTTTTNTTGKTLTEVTYFSSNNITINKVYGGGYFVFADTSDGYYCWGSGYHGNFGNGSTGNLESPTKWTNVSNIKKFMASTNHATAITEDGKYYAWGAGTNYARGDNDTGDISYPKYIDTLPNILAPSFEFDGYDKVFVNQPYEIQIWCVLAQVKSASTLDGLEFTGITPTRIYLPYQNSLYTISSSGMNVTWHANGTEDGYPLNTNEHVATIYVNENISNLTGLEVKYSSNQTQNRVLGLKFIINGVTILEETTKQTADSNYKTSYSFTPSTFSSITKYTKDTHTYDANQAQIITVSDPGTYNAQLSQGSTFSLKSTTIPATKASGLYTWAFHHGNFDNAYGDGDILTARDNGRFYADTPSYTGDIGTITAGSSTTSNTTYTFTPASTLTANVLMVAGGGGGGGRYNCGGGGAGGLVYTVGTTLSGTKTIVVGNGDSGGNGGAQSGYNGKDTTFTGLTTAVGGGYGGTHGAAGGTGGSGGGGGGQTGNGPGGSATSGQGFAGGTGSNSGSTFGGGGGGGGAGDVGGNGSDGVGGNGGIGKFFGTGSSYTDFGDEYGEGGYFASGAGGGSKGSTAGGIPGRGGGGYGARYYGYMGIGGSQHALPHTGGGGGGSGTVDRDQHPGYASNGDGGVLGHGGRGGSGIVLLQTNVALPNGSNTAVVQVGNPRRRSLPPTVDYMGSEVNRFSIIDGASMPTYKLPTHWYVDPIGSNSNSVWSTQGAHSLQKRADGGTSNVFYVTSTEGLFEYGHKMAQSADAIFMPVEAQRYNGLLAIGSNSTNDIHFEMAADGTAALYYDNGATLLSAGTIKCFTVGKWHHIALTVDSGGNAVGYVNGYPVVSGTYTSVAAVGSRSGNMHMRVGDHSITFRKFLTYEVSTYNFHMSPKQVLQRAAEVGLGPKLEYDGLNAINVVNAEPGSGTEITIYESNANDTSNLYVVSCNESSYLLSNAGTYYAQIKGTDTFTITRPLTVTDDHFPLYQYPPIDGTTTGLTQSESADTWNTWTISGASNGNGIYQAKTTHAPFSISFTAYRAFNNDVSDDNGQYVDASQKTNVGLILQLPSAKTIRKYRMYPVDHSLSSGAIPGSSTDPTLSGGDPDYMSRPKSWILKGSNDDAYWTDLDTVTDKPISIYGDVYSIDSPASYKYYQIFVVNIVDTSALLRIGEWQLWGDA
jgi:alpha-tubulin suppressor-like RCC1 family protein